ncbi:MAG: Dockerin type domain [Pseudonocardiales bacterium]|nr:Dockerin type domain [Pseudonocardiales bacterium]
MLQTSGHLNGTAQTPTTSTFAVEVTDAAGVTATRQFGLAPVPIIGDLNRDGQVDCADKSILMSQYQQTGPGHSADLNHDDIVNITDLSIMLTHWTGSSTSC